MRFPLTVGVMVACGLAVSAPIPKEKDKPKKDEDIIQGVWKLDKYDLGPAVPLPPGGLPPIHFTFKDGKLDVTPDGQQGEKQGTYKLDPTAKLKSIDLTEGDNGMTSPGIYELDGDTLKLCLAQGPTAVRPTEFAANGQGVVVLTFKREAGEKKDK